jgi:hypothetical protein
MSKSFKDSDGSKGWEHRGSKKRSRPAKFAGKKNKPKERDGDVDFSWGNKNEQEDTDEDIS